MGYEVNLSEHSLDYGAAETVVNKCGILHLNLYNRTLLFVASFFKQLFD